MLYKPKIDETINRYKEFWRRELKKEILSCLIWGIKKEQNKKLYEDRMRLYEEVASSAIPNLDQFYRAWRIEFQTRENELKICRLLEDDTIPVASPSENPFGGIGYGIYTGFLGGEVKFTKNDSELWCWSPPLLSSWEKIRDLRFDKNNYWVKRMMERMKFFVERAKGKFGINSYCIYDALNLAALLRGFTQIYVDIYRHPNELRKLMDFGVDFNIELYEMQRKIIGTYNGGVFWYSVHFPWLPNKSIFLSVDHYSLCNPKFYLKMGQEYQEKLIEKFGGGAIHIHALGLHLLPYVAKVKGLVGIEISEDPRQPRPFENLKKIKKITKDIPLVINCRKKEFIQGLKHNTLPGGVLYNVDLDWTGEYTVSGSTIEELNDLAKKTREYRAR